MIERARTLNASASGFWVALSLVAVYAVMRTAGVPETLLAAWTAVAMVAAIMSPLAALTMLAAIGPFTEAQTADGTVTPVAFLLAATGVSLLLHIALTRWLPRLSVPVMLAVALLVGTLLGVGVSGLRYGAELGIEALRLWVPGLGGAMTVLLAATWVASRAEIRPLYVAVGAITVGALLSVVNAATNDAVLASALGWLLRPDIDPRRLGGLLPAPNIAAALFIVGIIVALAIALSSSRRDVVALAAAAIAIQCVALVLTFSRSGYLALGLGAVLLLGRRWPRLGPWIVLAVVGIGLPVFVWLWLLRDVPLAADEFRFTAWSATARMWLDHPIIGAGFRSFEWLHAQYGSPLLDAPHNEWLRLFAEEGTLLGIVGAAFAIGTPIVLLRSRDLLAVGAGAAAAALFVAALFNNPFLSPQLNVPAFLVIGIGLGIVALGSRPPPSYAGDE